MADFDAIHDELSRVFHDAERVPGLVAEIARLQGQVHESALEIAKLLAIRDPQPAIDTLARNLDRVNDQRHECAWANVALRGTLQHLVTALDGDVADPQEPTKLGVEAHQALDNARSMLQATAHEGPAVMGREAAKKSALMSAVVKAAIPLVRNGDGTASQQIIRGAFRKDIVDNLVAALDLAEPRSTLP